MPFDTGTLSWVRDEIDLALDHAGQALARYAAAPADGKPLAEARNWLHQACGALTLVGLAGVTHFAETVEARLADLADKQDAADIVAIGAAAGTALAALRRYLDDLMAGHPDQPLNLYPPYRALALAAGQAEPSPASLFFPDLTRRPPRQLDATPPPPPRRKALRLGFARGLAKWRDGEARGLVEMKNAVAHVEQGCAEPAERAPWWIALAWFDTPAAAERNPQVEFLLTGIDRQIDAYAEGRPDAAPDSLLAGLLYDIAVAPAGDERRESVRAAYRLADLLPASTVDSATRREACRAPLITAMEEWERHSQGMAEALPRFHDIIQLLAATARDSNDAELARLVAAIADCAAWLKNSAGPPSQTIKVEMACALILVENAIEQEGARNPADEALFAAAVGTQVERLASLANGRELPALQPLRWRERQIIRQVAREIRASLEAIEPALDAYFGAPAEAAAQLPAAQAQLHGVAGAFALLGEEAAARIAGSTEARLAACRSGIPADFSVIAEHIATLAQFAETLRHGQPERKLLEQLAQAQEPAPAPAVPPEPAGETGASSATRDADVELLAIFTEEAHEVLATLAAACSMLAANPADREALTTVRRCFHTLKGSGRMVKLTDLGEVAYALERVLNRRLDEHLPADAELLRLVEVARALFGQWVAAIERQQPAPEFTALVAECEARLGGAAPAAAATPVIPAPAPAGEVVIGDLRLSPTLYRLFVDEAEGHIATLHRELRESPGVPSRELIRAAHTLAGISAGTGFASVRTLAHALENTLVRHSLAQVVPGEDTTLLIARAVGMLEGMVGAIAGRRAPADDTALAEELEAIKVAAAAAAPQPDTTPPPVSPLAERRQSRPADEIDPQLATLFLEEAPEQLHQIEAELRAWRDTPADAGHGQRIARLLHTFKGGARMCGAMSIGELAHSMETRVEQALASGGAAPALLDGLIASLDRASQMVDSLRQPGAAPVVSAPAAVTPAPTAEASAAVMLRVRADLIDHLVNEAGEMAIARSRIEGSMKGAKSALLDLTENIARLRSQLREFEIHAETSMQSRLGSSEAHQREFDPLEFDRFTRLQELTRMMAESVNDVATVQHTLLRQVEIAGEALTAQSRQNRELSHALLRARMVPFSTVAERLHRIVRQTAKELERQANLDIHGGNTPVDRNMLERMLGPLEHLLRNAVAHGIETPEARSAAGKLELGEITLDIVPSDNDIVLTLADDGAGLDLAAIRRRAVERGLLAADAQVDDAALMELIFHPGFSTAAQVSEIAGRGIGLDVVREEVTQLGGRVEISTAPGRGTQFRILLPLTLAVIPIMLVTAAGREWAIPASMVEEARQITPAEAVAAREAGKIGHAGIDYPWHNLPRLFGLAEEAGPPTWQLLLASGGARIALEAEALTQNLEVVVKSVGAQLARVPGITGATVLPDGSVTLIVNPVALTRRARPQRPAATAASRQAAAGEAPLVMVVDDSLTVRKISSRLLERAGYRVATAKDGIDALEQIARQKPDVILADIEMPRMDGFELVRALRADPQLADLPVIMITSRIAERHRQVARELGVRHYLGKPYDESELLGLIAGLIKLS